MEKNQACNAAASENESIMRLDVIADLGAMPSGALLNAYALAKIFKREPASISRAVARGELPHPAQLLGCDRWTAGAILKHHEKRMAEAAEDAERLNSRGA